MKPINASRMNNLSLRSLTRPSLPSIQPKGRRLLLQTWMKSIRVCREWTYIRGLPSRQIRPTNGTDNPLLIRMGKFIHLGKLLSNYCIFSRRDACCSPVRHFSSTNSNSVRSLNSGATSSASTSGKNPLIFQGFMSNFRNACFFGI